MTHTTPSTQPSPGSRPRAFAPFDPASVRTTYTPAGTLTATAGPAAAPSTTSPPAAGTTPATPVPPAVSAETVELVAALRAAAGLPGALVIVVDDAVGTGAEAVTMACLPTPQIRLGADLLTPQHRTRLQGALAHEIAHQALGHLNGSPPWRRLATGCGIGALLALAAHLPAWLVIALAAVAALNHLLATQVIRLQECDADLYAARLLDQAGRDGTAIVAATLATLAAPSLWQRTVGRLTSSHPTPAVRLRVLAGGRAPAWFGGVR
ncbi:M48 family metalloprotease [Streptosporangium sp. NPDC023615]|uniref:M48 family metalloprotease n=1 Tax=Streptosporangium sp. NPDC023615 TaxID=3154794 RepID=UPI00344770E6